MGSIQEVVDELHLSLIECNDVFMENENSSNIKSSSSLTPSDITHTTSSEPTTTELSQSSNYFQRQQNDDCSEEKTPSLSTGYERRRSIRRIDRAIKTLQILLHQESNEPNPIVLDDGITADLIMALTHVPNLLMSHEDSENNSNFSFYESTCEVSSCIILDYCCLPFTNTQYMDVLLDRCVTLCLNGGTTGGCSMRLYPLLSILNANLFHYEQQQNQVDQNNTKNDEYDTISEDGSNNGITNTNNNSDKKIFPSLSINECMDLLEVMIPISLIDFHEKSWKPPDSNNVLNENEVPGPIHLRVFLSFLIRHLFSTFSNYDTNNHKDDDRNENDQRFQSLLTNHVHPFLMELIEYSLDVIEGSSHLKIKTKETTLNHAQLIIQDVIQHVSLTLEFIHISQPWVKIQHDMLISLWTSFTNYIASFSSYIDHNSYQDSGENMSIVTDDILLRLLKLVLSSESNEESKNEHNNSVKNALIMSFLRLLSSQQQKENEHNIDLLTKALLSCTSCDDDGEWIHVLQSALLSTMVLPNINNINYNDPTISSYSRVNNLVQILLDFLQSSLKNQEINENNESSNNATEIDPWNYLIIEKMIDMNNGINNRNFNNNDGEKDNQNLNSIEQYMNFVLPQKVAQSQKEPSNNEESIEVEENETNTVNSSSQM